MARPTEYTEEQASLICEQVAEGKSLHAICKSNKLPTRQTVHNWLSKHKEFFDQYVCAKELSAEKHAEQVLEIADKAEHAESSVEVQAAKLRIEARQWYAKVTAPKKYGTKHVESTNVNTNANIEISKDELKKFNEILERSC